MPLDRYLHGLGRLWYLVVVLAVAGLVGSELYLSITGGSTATATVAVLEPAVTRATTNDQAQVTFDSIAQSRTVAEQVIRQMGLSISPEAMQHNVNVTLSRQLVSNVLTPLYIVNVKDKDPQRAVALDAAVIDTSKQVFLQLNDVNASQVDAAFAQQEQQMRDELAKANANLLTFETQHKAWKLDSQIDAQIGLVNGLRQASVGATAGATAGTSQPGDAAANLAQAQAELDRLRGLLDQYNTLAFNVALAQSAVNQIAGHQNDLALTNQPDATAAAQKAQADAQAKLTQARQALTAFQTANGVDDLPSNLSNQLSLVSSLRRDSLIASANSRAINDALTKENNNLQAMLALLPQYTDLTTQVTVAQGQLGQLEAQKIGEIVSRMVAPNVQVKVLDSAHLQVGSALAAIIPVIGLLLGVGVGLVLVYLFTYFDRSPRLAADAADITGLPVLAHVPDAF